MFFTEMLLPYVAKFVYFFVSSKDLASMNAGTAVPSMTTDILNNLQVIIAPNEVYQEYDNLVSPMFFMSKHISEQSRTLTAIRDALIPKLMNGEIRVSTEE